ncbi:MAG TPA: hemerythrin domain-containing protein [Rhodocyclaceae bacterium]
MPTTSTHASTERSRSRADSAAHREVIEMLKDDHKRVLRAFREFERMNPHEDPERCQELVSQTCAELQLHTELEEKCFYPAARHGVREEDLIEEAEVEHLAAKRMLDDLKKMSPEDEKFAATFKVLGEYVKHHVREEEHEIFPQLSRAKLDWQHLQEDMQEQRKSLMQQIMPQQSQSG